MCERCAQTGPLPPWTPLEALANQTRFISRQQGRTHTHETKKRATFVRHPIRNSTVLIAIRDLRSFIIIIIRRARRGRGDWSFHFLKIN